MFVLVFHLNFRISYKQASLYVFLNIGVRIGLIWILMDLYLSSYDKMVMFLSLFCRSLVCLLEMARPKDCCWLQGWGGDRHPSTSSHHGIRMSPLPSNIETANPLVMNHIHTHTHAYVLMDTFTHPPVPPDVSLQVHRRCMYVHGPHTCTQSHWLHPRQLWLASANEASWLPCPT